MSAHRRLHGLGLKKQGNAAEGDEKSTQVLQREKPLHQRHPSRIGKGLMPKKKHSAVTTAIPTIKKATVQSYADPYVDASVDLQSESQQLGTPQRNLADRDGPLPRQISRTSLS